MALLPVLTYPDARLRRVAQPVARFDADLVDFVADLFETMAHEGGVGLAATQVGDLRRVVVIECGSRLHGVPRPVALVNPVIVERAGEIVWREGCLSLPSLYAEVDRDQTVVVEYADPHGAPQRETFSGLEAVCVQHEVDHLDGGLFIDHLGALERKAVLAEYAPDPVESAP